MWAMEDTHATQSKSDDLLATTLADWNQRSKETQLERPDL
jgi:hypothetical protein